jgi:anaerobic selenocysteine-containing dehydrogenase
MRTEIIELNEQDAKTAGISEGDRITLIGENFEKQGTAHLNGLHSGLVASTSLFGSLVEKLTLSNEEDPMLKVESLQVKPVRIEKA